MLNLRHPAFVPCLPLAARSLHGNAVSTTRPKLNTPIKPIFRRQTLHASFKEDFFKGPSDPPRPRPLYQVILFSVTTNLLWYGYYKYCIEEELKQTLNEGPGGIGALLPFTIGVCSPLYLPLGGPAEVGVASGVAWIVGLQFYLYKRINKLMVEKGNEAPLTPWWVFVPGFNIVAGLRSVHWLSVLWGGEKDDPVVDWFPFLAKDTLGMGELVTNPKLWIKFLA